LKLSIVALTLIITISSSYADSIFDAPNNLGILSSKIKNAWSRDSQLLSGIEQSLSRKECRNALIAFFEEAEPNKKQFMARYSKPFTASDILDDKIQDLKNYKKKSLIGIARSYRGTPAGGLSRKNSIHTKTNCRSFFEITGTRVITQANDSSIQCRETRVQSDELYYDILFCEGEQSGYTMFPSEMDLAPTSAVLDLIKFW
jgi:hypothetical protein